MALTYLSEVLRQAASEPWVDQDWQVEVTDERGLGLFSLATILADAPSVR
jgi:hypothetical protein